VTLKLVDTLEARIAELEAEKVRMREWLDMKDLSEDAPRARETIRSLRARIARSAAELDDLRAALGPGEVRDQVDRALEILR